MIRLGAVGDVVRTLPAVAALRAVYPGAHIAWLVEPGAAGVMDGQSWVDEVIVFPREVVWASLVRGRPRTLYRTLRSFLSTLRGRRFDLVLDFHAILKSGVLSALSGAPIRVTYAHPHGRELSWIFASHRARLEPRRLSRFERNEGLVRFLASQARASGNPYQLDPDRVARMRAALAGAAAPISIHPGTSDAKAYKRYSVDGYARVASALRDRVSSIVTWGSARDDRAFAEAVVDASRGAARLAPATPTFADLAALLSCSRLYVGSDTGPMHVASLVGTPVVQILGPTDPIENAPYPATSSHTLRVPLPCSPCRRGCAAATCMRAVPSDAVIAAARNLLGAS